MARSKKSKKKSKTSTQPQLSLKNYIVKVARKLPIHECRIYDNWKEEGKTQAFVSRERSNGNFIVGFYLIDLWCLGLKDSLYREMTKIEYEDIVQEIDSSIKREMDTSFVIADPNLIYNIIYGAVEYAEGLGFPPAKDFNITEYMLDDVEEIPFIDIEFGKDGMPFFVNGPDDNVGKVLRTLDKFVGEGNYKFIMHMD